MNKVQWLNIECRECGRQFYVQPYRRYTAMFCSALCRNRAVAKSTAKKRGDALRFTGEGKGYPKLRGRPMHRVIAERKLGRKLRPGEIAHHENRNKQDCRPSNIKVLPSQSAHAKLHFPKGRKGRFHAAT